MKIYFENKLSNKERLKLVRRSTQKSDSETKRVVKNICDNIKRRGDVALRKYCKKYDKVVIKKFKVDENEIRDAKQKVPAEFIEAIKIAKNNIQKFHESQKILMSKIQTTDGVLCWREARPIENVGLYIPAGSAPLPSTVLMLGVPAIVAGCKRIILCSPAKSDGNIDPLILTTASLIGIDEIYKIGGAQAIAAMAYGTKTIPKVDKIFGPGNRYVMAAKQFVSMDLDGAAIDLLAGPSEVLIIADESAKPEVIAYDLISQSEHDADAQAILVTTSLVLAEQVIRLLQKSALKFTKRKTLIKKSLDNSYIIVVNSVENAIKFANDYAAEHLVINLRNAEEIVPLINNAGSVFVGPFSPVTAGDYASGTNHTLPTAGTARWTGGVSLDSFLKYVTFQSITEEGLRNLKSTLINLAKAEGLDAHAQAVISRITTE